MGARTVYTFETEPGAAVYLYSHSGGEDKLTDLANAIHTAKPRWQDESYCLRIMVSNLIGDSWDSETGFGLWTENHFEEHYQPTQINVRRMSVTLNSQVFTFQQFVSEFGGNNV